VNAKLHFNEVVELFLGEVAECLERLDQTAGPAELEADMHFLKGSALNLGFESFADLCQSGETAAALGDTSTIDVAAVRTLFDQSKAAFDQSLDQMVA